LFFSEQKRLEKARKKEEEKAKKEAERAKTEVPEASKKKKAEEISDPREYFKSRVRYIEEQRAKDINPFPHKYHVSISLPEYHRKYGYIENDTVLEDVVESVAGLIEYL
jgi:lysyl-tRNA synthetase class 2